MEHNTRFTKLQRPNAGLHKKYLNLKITSNMRLTLPHLDQNANYDATRTQFLVDK